MQLNALVLSYVASAVIAVIVTVIAARRRTMPGAAALALLMFSVAWWLVANALEAAAIDRTVKVAWSVVAYPGIQGTAVFFLLFALRWTHQDAWLSRRHIGLLLIVPLLSVGVAATNEWHRLLWPSVSIVQAWGVTAVYAHGPWFWIEIAYAYTLIGAGLLAIVRALHQHPAVYSTRTRAAIVASAMPIVASAAYAAGLDASVHADLSSIAFAGSGVVAAWGILGLRVLDPLPVAWATLVDMLGDAVLVLAPERRVAAVNPAAARLLGIGRDAIGRPIEDVLGHASRLLELYAADDDLEIEMCVDGALDAPGAPDGATDASCSGRWFNVRVRVIRDRRGQDVGRLIVLRDVTERRRMVETIRQRSLTDELTGLLNRRGFFTAAERQMEAARRTRTHMRLLFADLDGLKEINDRLGHEAGDRTIREFADLLRTASFRDADVVGRLGGDEFAVLVTDAGAIDAVTLIERVQAAVREANAHADRPYSVSASLGAAAFDPSRSTSLDELIAEADQRMYLDKHSRQTGQDRHRRLERAS